MQVYTRLEYGDISPENARAYFNLSQHYLNRKIHFLHQAKVHALNARSILEQLNIQPTTENLLAVDIYLLLVQCSLKAKKYILQRDIKVKNKHLLSIDTTHMQHDLRRLEQYLATLQNSMKPTDYDPLNMKYLFLKLEVILSHVKDLDPSIDGTIDQLVAYIDKYYASDRHQRLIDLYVRCGSYLSAFSDKARSAFRCLDQAVDLAEEQERTESSRAHRCQLARALLERGQAKVRTRSFTGHTGFFVFGLLLELHRSVDQTEREFQRAIELYKQPNHPMDRATLNAIDELATLYVKMEKYQVGPFAFFRDERTISSCSGCVESTV